MAFEHGYSEFGRAPSQQHLSISAEHEKADHSGVLQTPVYFPPDRRLLTHNENTFESVWPRRLVFACVEAAERGGCLVLADGAKVLRALPATYRDEFARLGIGYVRRHTSVERSWQTLYSTRSRNQLAEILQARGITSEWNGDVLCTKAVRPAIIIEPSSGMPCWVAQPQHWASLEPRAASACTNSRDALFGDGRPIPREVMVAIMAAYAQTERHLSLVARDVLLLDNLRYGHGRLPYIGSRRMLVSLLDPIPAGELVNTGFKC